MGESTAAWFAVVAARLLLLTLARLRHAIITISSGSHQQHGLQLQRQPDCQTVSAAKTMGRLEIHKTFMQLYSTIIHHYHSTSTM